jgi:hypothetical protein
MAAIQGHEPFCAALPPMILEPNWVKISRRPQGRYASEKKPVFITKKLVYQMKIP